MKVTTVKNLLVMALITLALGANHAMARDTKHLFSIDEAFASSAFKEKLDPKIKFIFGKQAYPEPLANRGEFVSNRKTNAFGKSDQAACEWALLSALLSFQDRALAEGGNAVVDIVSFYRRDEMSSETEYECHAGAIVAGVALKGSVVMLPR